MNTTGKTVGYALGHTPKNWKRDYNTIGYTEGQALDLPCVSHNDTHMSVTSGEIKWESFESEDNKITEKRNCERSVGILIVYEDCCYMAVDSLMSLRTHYTCGDEYKLIESFYYPSDYYNKKIFILPEQKTVASSIVFTSFLLHQLPVMLPLQSVHRLRSFSPL